MSGTIRDIAIIVLAFESIIIGILLIILVIQVWRLMRLLQHEMKPILESTQETTGTIRGTATFLGKHLVNPVMRVASYAAGFAQAARTLVGFPRQRRSAAPGEEQKRNSNTTGGQT